ncbi:MAG: S8 family serine peptidase, partial [Acidobacteriota bacterium]
GQLRGSVDAVIVSQNAAQITLPGSSVARLAEMPEVARMMAVPVMEPHLDKQDDSLGLRTGFWNDNVDGGVWDVGVLDTGVQQNHPSLDHLTFESTHGTTDSNGHGTKVAGIIASDHGTYRGMAYSLDNMLVGDCISKSIKHGDWMVGDRSDDPEVISMSCGSSGSVSSDYSSSEKFWDALVDNHRVLFINSAGNTGDGTSTITRPATAYNLISVANVYDNDTTSRSDDFLRYTSARGPSFGGRKKPDLSAPGHNTKTTNNDWATSDDFVNFGGTSAAAPHVAGGAILVTDLRSNDDPKATKAVLINSADAWDSNGKVNGSQWNKEFGWGYLNLGKAWLNGTDVFTHTIAEGGTEYKLYLGTMHAWEKATLVWHRHADYNGSSTPTQIADLTDLDLYAYRATNGAKMDSSISFVDNVEQVTVNADGEYVLKVKLIGDIDSSLPNQAYALATEENFIQVDPPSLSAVAVDVVTPSGFPGLFPVQMIVLVTNSGDAPAGRTAIWPDAPNGWAAVPLIPELTVPGNTTLAFPIMVFSNCTSAGQTGTIDITAVSGAYGEDYVATTTGTVNCI